MDALNGTPTADEWDTTADADERDTHRGTPKGHPPGYAKGTPTVGTPKGHPPLRQRDTHRCTEWTTHRGAAVATTLDLAGTYDLAEAPADICGDGPADSRLRQRPRPRQQVVAKASARPAAQPVVTMLRSISVAAESEHGALTWA